MKRSIIIILSIITVTCISVGIHYNNQRQTFSALMLENIEALSSSESIIPPPCLPIGGMCIGSQGIIVGYGMKIKQD